MFRQWLASATEKHSTQRLTAKSNTRPMISDTETFKPAYVIGFKCDIYKVFTEWKGMRVRSLGAPEVMAVKVQVVLGFRTRGHVPVQIESKMTTFR